MDTVKNLFLFGLGAIVGSFVTIKVIKQKYIDEANEEIQSVKDLYKEKEAIAKGWNEVKEMTKITDKEVEDMKVVDSEVSGMFFAEENDFPREEDYFSIPYLISYEEYANGVSNDGVGHNFDKEILYYYSLDDTIVDENEDFIKDVDGTIGEDNLRFFGVNEDEPNVLYIRNEKIGTDYELILMEESYAKSILGTNYEGSED